MEERRVGKKKDYKNEDRRKNMKNKKETKR